MSKVTGAFFVLIGMSSFAFGCAVQAPEIDTATGVAALTLLGGGLLVIRSRKKWRQK
jgi:MYXO-CTERM domain-containing protein